MAQYRFELTGYPVPQCNARGVNEPLWGNRWFLLAILVTVLAAVSGCVSTSRVAESPLEPESTESLSWWRVKFRFEWSEGTDPDFSQHTLVADRVLRPVINQYGGEMPLWRFHRRAARDNAGNQFSFIYYASGETRERVQNTVNANTVVQQLTDRAILLSVQHTRGRAANNNVVSATSDPSWPDELQRSWPWFIMGVSQTWLDLISEFKEKQGPVPAENMDQVLDYYFRLDEKISEQWGEYGRHAYFHHLNAIFGYRPVYIYETEEWQNF